MRTLAVAICFSFLALASQALAQERTYSPGDKYFPIANDTYWMKGVRDVSGIGTYGRKTGKGGFGWLVRNGFEANGKLDGVVGFEATESNASRESVRNAAIEANAEFDENSNPSQVKWNVGSRLNYSTIVVSISDWEDVYDKLNAEYEEGNVSLQRRFQDKHFRLIDRVVYATDFESEQGNTVSLESGGEAEALYIRLSAKIEGSTQTVRTFTLTKKQIIAYSFRRLCWKNGLIAHARGDDPGPSDNSDCDNFE